MQSTPENGLPEPDAESARHADKVAAHLRELIGAGSISFAEFMQAVLYAPGLGYYVAGSRKFGADGDFVTAPEVSDVFGLVVANQCAAVLDELGVGDILEPGAGSGALAVGILRRMAALGKLPDRYRILEVSPELQERQRTTINERIPEHARRVEWIADLPDEFCGVVVANEVADAIPVERFRMQAGNVMQVRVEIAGDGFGWRYDRAPESLATAVRSIEQETGHEFPDGYTSEVSPGLRNWIGDVCGAVVRGCVLLFDYGMPRREFYAPGRADGWLRCHFRHRAHSDPLILTGIQDVTSWVDFTAVAESAVAAGMTVGGYLRQAEFLLHGGLDEALQGLADLPPAQQALISGQIKKLTLPGEMGENFKSIALCRGVSAPPAFRFSDKAHQL